MSRLREAGGLERRGILLRHRVFKNGLRRNLGMLFVVCPAPAPRAGLSDQKTAALGGRAAVGAKNGTFPAKKLT